MSVLGSPRPVAYGAYSALIGAAIVAMACVYLWADSNTTVADAEHTRLIKATATMCSVFAVAAATTWLVAAVARLTALSWAARGLAGAFIAVAAGTASTLLIAMAISPATDPGDFGQPLFRFAYVGALLLSLALGLAAAWATTRSQGAGAAVGAVLLGLGLTIAAWGFLAVASSELNQCVVDDEFPLATDHVCSGY
jgi:hypothetical protein